MKRVKLFLVVLAFLTITETGLSEAKSPVPESPKTTKSVVNRVLPKMVDYGSDKCIPCKAMAPILAKLRDEYKGIVTVQFIDVTKNREAAVLAKIRLIPTQIFYDSTGAEVARHEGFMAKDAILSVWKEHRMLPPEKK